MNEIKEIKELLRAARKTIDGEMNSHLSEYTALDRLERAMDLLVQKFQKMDKELYRVQNPNP